jgi:hypothetical protein
MLLTTMPRTTVSAETPMELARNLPAGTVSKTLL